MKIVLFALLLFGFFWAPCADAFTTSIGDVFYGNSWSLNMQQSLGGASYNFMRMDVYMDGNLFRYPGGVTNPSAPWTVKYESPTSIIVSRTGNQTANFYWTWTWTDPRTTAKVHVATYDNGIWREGGVYTYTVNGAESWVNDGWNPGTDIPSVPEPTTLVLIGAGLGLAALRRRRKS